MYSIISGSEVEISSIIKTLNKNQPSMNFLEVLEKNFCSKKEKLPKKLKFSVASNTPIVISTQWSETGLAFSDRASD